MKISRPVTLSLACTRTPLVPSAAVVGYTAAVPAGNTPASAVVDPAAAVDAPGRLSGRRSTDMSGVPLSSTITFRFAIEASPSGRGRLVDLDAEEVQPARVAGVVRAPRCGHNDVLGRSRVNRRAGQDVVFNGHGAFGRRHALEGANADDMARRANVTANDFVLALEHVIVGHVLGGHANQGRAARAADIRLDRERIGRVGRSDDALETNLDQGSGL